MFHPEGKRKLVWDGFAGLAIFYSVIQVPFRIGFLSNTPVGPAELAVEYTVISIFFADILITFNTAYVDPLTDEFVMDRWRIATKFLSFWFWVDFISSIPLADIALTSPSFSQSVRLLRILRLLRLVRLIKLAKLIDFKSLQRISRELNMGPAVMSVVILLLQVLLVAHIIACFWFFITTSTATGANDDIAPVDGAGMTWASHFGLQAADVMTQYIASLYWTFFTIFGVGFGDIRAVNTGERFFSVFVLLLGTLMNGAIISKVAQVITSRNLLARDVKIKMAELKIFLSTKKIPMKLKQELEEAYSYYLERRPAVLEKGKCYMLMPMCKR